MIYDRKNIGDAENRLNMAGGNAPSAATPPDFVIVSGMSGAGRTEVMHLFEDLGYYCVDNLPSYLIGNVMKDCQEHKMKMCCICDTRNKLYFDDLINVVNALKATNLESAVIFLDADDEKLIARYKSSRRRHPMCEDGDTIMDGIKRERELMYPIKERATYVIDTTTLLPKELRNKLENLFSADGTHTELFVTVCSFGFKHGLPPDADLVVDVRFLPNPYYVPELRPLTGLDDPIKNFVFGYDETKEFEKKWQSMLDTLMPGYVKEGKQQLLIGVGCTGGQHRSVALAESTGSYLASNGYRVTVAHRDLKFAEK